VSSKIEEEIKRKERRRKNDHQCKTQLFYTLLRNGGEAAKIKMPL
jgi:hypothetical protein